MKKCLIKKCRNETDHVSGYCSDACLQADMPDDNEVPVTTCRHGDLVAGSWLAGRIAVESKWLKGN